MDASATLTHHVVTPDTTVETNGAGPALDLGPLAGKLLLLLLKVTEVIEQESLHVSVWGAPDGQDWGGKPLFAFPQVFYCGLTPAALDLRRLPEIKFLQARWEVFRWGRGYPRPYFRFSLEVQEFPLDQKNN